MTNKPTPPGWGEDTLSEFIETARNNAIASFVKRQPEYKVLLELDSHFRQAVAALSSSSDEFAGIFLMRSHASYLSACMLALAGEAADFPIPLRGCLESALYGLHIHDDEDRLKIWLDRLDNADGRKKCRKEFSFSNVMKTLEGRSAKLAAEVRKVYDSTIDFGAHPNIGSLGTTLKITSGDQAFRFDFDYLSGDPVAHMHCYKLTADAGLGALLVFNLVYPRGIQDHRNLAEP